MNKFKTLFENLKDLIACNTSLISYGRTTEAESAQNILSYIASLEDQTFQDAYDVLRAMSGDPRVILNCTKKVDSKLYELVFDLIRATNYVRLETAFTGTSHEERDSLLEDIRRSASLPWMTQDEARDLDEAMGVEFELTSWVHPSAPHSRTDSLFISQISQLASRPLHSTQ